MHSKSPQTKDQDSNGSTLREGTSVGNVFQDLNLIPSKPKASPLGTNNNTTNSGGTGPVGFRFPASMDQSASPPPFQWPKNTVWTPTNEKESTGAPNAFGIVGSTTSSSATPSQLSSNNDGWNAPPPASATAPSAVSTPSNAVNPYGRPPLYLTASGKRRRYK